MNRGGEIRIAHLADLHLGFRQYYRQTPQGINQREADVAQAFRRVVDDVIGQAPDLVIIAGDLFHSVRPANPAILDAFNQLRRLRQALPQAPLVIVAGDHDTPRSVETGTILRLFEAIDGVYAVVHDARRLSFESPPVSVLCVPFATFAGPERPDLSPEPGARRNLLVLHGELAGLPREYDPAESGMPTLELADLHAERWDYVALGHYHVARAMAPNAWYAGSIEYVSRNPWGELRQERAVNREGQKGWLLVRLGGGGGGGGGSRLRVECRPVPLARRYLDLPPIAASGMDAAQLSEEIVRQAEEAPDGLDDQVVRQVVYDVPRLVAREIDHEAVRGFKARALHYHLDLRRPESRRTVGVGGPGGGPARTLTDIVVEYLEGRALAPGVARDRLVQLGRHYMEQAEREPGVA